MQQLKLFDHEPSNTLTAAFMPQTNNKELCHITLAGQTLAYRFKRSSKRRTIGLAIDQHGLSVVAPRWVAQPEIDATLLEKQKWIFAKLLQMRERHSRAIAPPVIWCHGGNLPYLGQTLLFYLSVDGTAANQLPTLDSKTNTLTLGLPLSAAGDEIKEHMQIWLKQQARALFIERLDHYAARLGVSYTNMSLSSAKTRWGSCNEDGYIRLNWRLIHFAQNVIDYVVAHELAHLKEMNHGPRFWQTVASIFPEYEQARAQLKQALPAL